MGIIDDIAGMGYTVRRVEPVKLTDAGCLTDVELEQIAKEQDQCPATVPATCEACPTPCEDGDPVDMSPEAQAARLAWIRMFASTDTD